MALQMPKSLKPDTPGVTLRPRGRESFVAPIEAVRMDKTADATAESGSMPQRLAIDVRNVSLRKHRRVFMVGITKHQRHALLG